MIIPDHLYKYEAFSTRSLQNLKTQTVYFGSPLNFNDPYDSALSPSIAELSDEDIERIRTTHLANPNLSIRAREELNALNTVNLRKFILDGGADTINKSIHQFLATRGVTCFSETNTNILMWSHYGGHYKGFCLEFATTSELFKKIKKVIYSGKMPSINLVKIICDRNLDEYLDLFCTKSMDWSYEREWRCIHKISGQAFNYPAESLTGVYFGPDMETSMIEIICLILRGQNEHVRFWRGSRSRTSFAVEFEPFEYTSYLEAKRQGLR